jgi:glutamate 5-kinase
MGLVVIKLGSSIVADDRGDPRMDVIRHVCEETARLHDEGSGVALVTSGAIARGVRVMDLQGRPQTIDELQAASALGQGKLFRVYEELLAERAVPSAQVLLTFFDLSARTHYLNARRTLRKLLDWGVVPVINENDTTATDEISFGDNDFLAAQVAVLLGADGLFLLTDVDGLYTADPGRDPTAELVPEVSDFTLLDRLQIGFAASPLGSGGMRSKVVAAEMATAAGIPARILDGTVPGPLARALRGEGEGTRFAPQRGRVSSFKLWLKYAKPSHGLLVVDEGAGRALRERGTSLLPVGVVEVEGDFQAGDAVEVASNEDGAAGRRAIGKGIVNYSADELRRIKGMKTAEASRVVPRATEEAVHRDYFVLE